MNWPPELPTIFYTAAWVFWIVWFILWETLAIMDPGPDDTLTEHVRPIIQGTSFGWFIGTAFLLWLVWHFLIENTG